MTDVRKPIFDAISAARGRRWPANDPEIGEIDAALTRWGVPIADAVVASAASPLAAGMLSQHFSLAELTRTSKPFPNLPNATEVDALALLCDRVLEPVRAHFKAPVKVNSGFRSAKVNAAVGSKETSQHRRGEAADIEIAGVSNAALARWIRDNLRFDQLILEAHVADDPNSGWVHVSYRADRARQSVLTMTLGSHGAVYTQGIAA